jgi:hypothetical protein
VLRRFQNEGALTSFETVQERFELRHEPHLSAHRAIDNICLHRN